MPQWVLRQRIPCGNALRGPPTQATRTQATEEIFYTEGTYGKAIDVRAGAFGPRGDTLGFTRAEGKSVLPQFGRRERVSPAHTDPRWAYP
jgi:hypothetical protein